MALAFLEKWESTLKLEKVAESCDSKALNCSEDMAKHENTCSDIAENNVQKRIEEIIEENFIDEVYMRNWQE